MRRLLAAGAAGYLLGSLPFGVWIGRLRRRGLDVREHGSGSTGATNVLRVVGPAAGATVFALDVAKGTIAARVGAGLAGEPGAAVAGLGAVVGHAWPALAAFRGGKSVATAFGGLMVVSRAASAAAVAGGMTVLLSTRTMSAGSLTAATTATIATAYEAARSRRPAPFLFAAGATALIVYRHRPNIERMWRGEEPTVRLRRGGDAGA